MLDAVEEDKADILRQDIVAVLDPRRRLAEGGERQGGAGAGPLDDAGVVSGGIAEADDIVDDLFLDIDLVRIPADPHQVLAADDLLDRVGRNPVLLPADHLDLVLMRGIAHRKPEHETVHLGIRKHLGALGAGRVLRGDDHKRLGHGIGVVIDGDDALFHGLQEGRLRAACRAVQLVRQKQVAEDGALLIVHLARLPVKDGIARDVGGENVRRELDAVIIQAQGPGDRNGHRGLSNPGDVLHQDMSAGDDRQQNLDQRLVLADDHLADLADNGTGIADGCKFAHI